MSVTPDGFLEVAFAGFRYPLALELDRGTESQLAWRRKVRSIVEWYRRSYPTLFGTTSLTVLVVIAHGGELRLRNLLRWTKLELVALGREDYGRLFRMTNAPADQTESFLFGSLWYVPGHDSPMQVWDELP